jgi:dipeptidyl aminopeptidase/acylaminoacyl peptidase
MLKYMPPYNLILKILIALPLGLFLFVFILLVRNTYLPRYSLSTTPKDYNIPYQDISFKTKDGFLIKGWLIIKDKEKPVIILLHGLGANKSDVLDFAQFLYSASFNILMFDFRAHGESRGMVTSFGLLEERDLEGAIEYLESNPLLKDKMIGLFGISMGGAIAIVAGASHPEIKAIVVDSPYVDLDESVITHTKMILPLPWNWLGRLAVMAYRLRFLTDSSKFSPLKTISRISPRTVFIINGARDDRMRPEDAKRLYDAAGEPKELWLVEGAGHLEGYSNAPGEYEKKVAGFFKEYLK